MTSRYDTLINFARLSEKQAAWASRILAEAQDIIDAALADCRSKMKAEKRHLLDGAQTDVDAKVAAILSGFSRAPWDLFGEFRDGRALAWRVGAEDYLDICKNFLGPRLRKAQ